MFSKTVGFRKAELATLHFFNTVYCIDQGEHLERVSLYIKQQENSGQYNSTQLFSVHSRSQLDSRDGKDYWISSIVPLNLLAYTYCTVYSIYTIQYSTIIYYVLHVLLLFLNKIKNYRESATRKKKVKLFFPVNLQTF